MNFSAYLASSSEGSEEEGEERETKASSYKVGETLLVILYGD